MDENRIKKLVEKILHTTNKDFTVRDFRVLPTNKFENGKWVHESYAVFVSVGRPANYYFEPGKERDLESKLETYLGFEFCLEFH